MYSEVVIVTKIFSIWRFVISVGWARSGLWETTTKKDRRTYLFSLHLVERNGDKALSLLIGPVSLIVGFAT